MKIKGSILVLILISHFLIHQTKAHTILNDPVPKLKQEGIISKYQLSGLGVTCMNSVVNLLDPLGAFYETNFDLFSTIYLLFFSTLEISQNPFFILIQSGYVPTYMYQMLLDY